MGYDRVKRLGARFTSGDAAGFPDLLLGTFACKCSYLSAVKPSRREMLLLAAKLRFSVLGVSLVVTLIQEIRRERAQMGSVRARANLAANSRLNCKISRENARPRSGVLF